MPASFLLALTVFLAPGQTDPALLVRKLSDESFAVREKAQAELLKLGIAAEPALRKGLTDADPQIRDISRQLLDRVNTTNHNARMQAFLEDKDDRLKPPLAGWKRFAAVAGNG